MLLSADERLNRARIVLERRGTVATDLLAPEICDSWTRCLAAGLDPYHPPEIIAVDGAALAEARQQREPLRRQALAEMENLYHQIAGTNFLIALAAPDGLLLDTLGDASFGATAQATAIRPGTSWAETNCGTNALGTTALMGRSYTIHGREHFFNRHGDLTCSAVPIFAPDGAVAGILDASSNCRSRQRHTQALVGMAATQIENGLFCDRHRQNRLIAFHSRGEYLHTLSVGLIAVDDDGTILAVNAQARFLLQGLPAVPGQRFDAVFSTRFGVLMDHCGEPHRLADRVGSTFVAIVENRPSSSAAPSSSGQSSSGQSSFGLSGSAAERTDGSGHQTQGGKPSGTLVPTFVAGDPAVKMLVRQIEAAAVRSLPILIRGETGTGKEQLARHAHRAAGRRGAVVPVNCAALPDSLIEAELFGYAEGAFTGARRGGAPGLVAEADGGTLFLDEIGDMPPTLQAVLLRLLDDWTIRPVGGGRRRQVDVLLVAATNADLLQAIAGGRFRADLYYRLNTVEVTLPPLRLRHDFDAIAEHLLKAIDPDIHLTVAALHLLAGRPWPGNIRELRSVLTRLSLAQTGPVIDAAAVAAMIDAPALLPVNTALASPTRLRDLLGERVVSTHRETGGNISETARRLGVSRNTIYRVLSRQPHHLDA